MGLLGNRADVYAFTNPLIRSGEFVLGVLLAVLVESGWRPRWPFLPAAVLLVIVAGVVSARSGVWAQSVVDVILMPFFALVILTAGLLADLRGRTGLLQRRWLTYCGEVSFGFYLVHELVILNLAPHLPGTTRLDRVSSLVVLMVVACLSAVLLHHGVERPAQRRIRAGWGRRRDRRPVAP